MRKLLMGCGGLSIAGVIVVVIIVVVAAAGSGGDGEAPVAEGGGGGGATEGGGNGGGANGGEQQSVAAIGESIQVGDTSWTVNSAEQAKKLTAEFSETKQGNFVIVDFTFVNNSGEARTLDSTLISLEDGEGRTFEVDTDNMMYVPQENSIFLEQVNPGVTKEGAAIFTVAPDASDFTLVVSGGFLSGEEGRIDLGS